MGRIREATRNNFGEEVADGLVLVDVWGPQCAPCLALMPVVENLPDEYDGLDVVKVEAPKARRLCIDLQVMGLPSFLLYRDGEEVSRLSAPDLGEAELRAWLDEHVREQVA